MTESAETQVVLARSLEHALRDGHPWIYRDAVRSCGPAGTIARVTDGHGRFVAAGICDDGPIAVRVFTVRDEQLGDGLLRSRIAAALSLRARFIDSGQTNAYRLIHGEGDRLPGFVVDRYGSVAVLKTDGQGALLWRERFADLLREPLEHLGITSLLLRASNADSEAISEKPYWGELTAAVHTIVENSMKLRVDLLHGQKTGMFLDQRDSRQLVCKLAADLRVLNLYGYSGGFSVAAGLGGARSVQTVDIAAAALALACDSWQDNALDSARHEAVKADVTAHLAALTQSRARFDLVIADPPSFAPRDKSVDAAIVAYRALHSACLSLISPGGYYLAGSCSSHITRAMFADTVQDGARKAKRSLQLLTQMGAPIDHPRIAAFAEGDYLKANLYRVF
jgi:23S rRNA (cytosine1962-C5)-methyltransferase